MVRTVLILGRMSNLPTVWTNVLAGWFLAGGTWDGELMWLMVGVSLLYVAGMTLNDAFDANWDREHAPERPIPSGAISEKAVWILGIAQLAAGIGIILGLTQASPAWLVALVVAILLYDWIHKRTAWSILAMGSCRGLVVLLAGSGVADAIPAEIWWWALGLSVFVAGITLVARGERTGGGFKALAYGLLAAPMVSEFLIRGKPIAALMVYVFLVMGGRGKLVKEGALDLGAYIPLLIASICLLDAAMISSSDGYFFCVVCFLLTLLLQRKIPAT